MVGAIDACNDVIFPSSTNAMSLIETGVGGTGSNAASKSSRAPKQFPNGAPSGNEGIEILLRSYLLFSNS